MTFMIILHTNPGKCYFHDVFIIVHNAKLSFHTKQILTNKGR